jgi:AraC-like DNA-binding protein
VLVAVSVRLCPPPITGACDLGREDGNLNGGAPQDHRSRPDDPPAPAGGKGRSVLVLATDPVMRAFADDAISAHHDVAEAADVDEALKAVASGVRIDLIIAGCFVGGEPAGIGPCATVARALYGACPWIPVAVIADAPPPSLKADVLLTGVRAFMPSDVAPAELISTIARVARRLDAPVPTNAHVAAIRQSFDVLDQTIRAVPALTALAAMVAMSRSHFSRTFHAVAGISLRDYVRDLRLKRAQELMRASRLSLSAVATEAGFYDLPHFNKAFRHRFGMSPTQFRLASLSSHAPPAI